MSKTVKIKQDLLEIEFTGKINGQPVDIIPGKLQVVVNGIINIEIPLEP